MGNNNKDNKVTNKDNKSNGGNGGNGGNYITWGFRRGIACYLATDSARVSRITLTFICPG
jgi:hypothetical protein